jgi:hypothetical protein
MSISQELRVREEASPLSKDHVERTEEAALVDGLFSALQNDRKRLRRMVNAILARLERTR